MIWVRLVPRNLISNHPISTSHPLWAQQVSPSAPGHVPCQLTLKHQPQVGPFPFWGLSRHQLALAVYALPEFTPLPPNCSVLDQKHCPWQGWNQHAKGARVTGLDGCRVVSLAPVPFLPNMKPTTAYSKYSLKFSLHKSNKQSKIHIFYVLYLWYRNTLISLYLLPFVIKISITFCPSKMYLNRCNRMQAKQCKIF